MREMAQKITGKPALCAADLELAVAQGALGYRELQEQEKKRREAEAQEKVRRETEAREKARREAETGAIKTPAARNELLGQLAEQFINTYSPIHEFKVKSPLITLKKSLSKMPVPSDEKILLGHQAGGMMWVIGFIITDKGLYCRTFNYHKTDLYHTNFYSSWSEFLDSEEILANSQACYISNGAAISDVINEWIEFPKTLQSKMEKMMNFWESLQKYLRDSIDKS